MTEAKEVKTVNIEIQLDETVAMGQYANMVMGQHSSSEFVLDFIFLPPGQTKAKVRSRIIMSPEHAKRFLKMLTEGVANYEHVFGEIRVQPAPPPPVRTMQ